MNTTSNIILTPKVALYLLNQGDFLWKNQKQPRRNLILFCRKVFVSFSPAIGQVPYISHWRNWQLETLWRLKSSEQQNSSQSLLTAIINELQTHFVRRKIFVIHRPHKSIQSNTCVCSWYFHNSNHYTIWTNHYTIWTMSNNTYQILFWTM